jgi:hypothetical protein
MEKERVFFFRKKSMLSALSKREVAPLKILADESLFWWGEFLETQ